MARHPRLIFSGAIYHVVFRGVGRQKLFLCDADYERLLKRVAEAVELFGVRLYLYCLMSNHVHLLVETPRANLSRFMSSVLTGYSIYFNIRHGRSGHVTEGRYKAQVVSGDEYLLRLSRYIHLNPVRVEGLKDAPLAKRMSVLREYRWSSYRGYIGLRRPEEFVAYGPLRQLTRERGRSIEESYRDYVEGGLAESDEDMQKLVRGSPLGIGAGEFLDGLKAGVRALRGVRVKEEDIALRRELAQVPTEDILEMVCKELRIEQGELIRRKRGNWRRSLTAYLLQKHGGLTQREVAGILGLKTGSAVSVEVRQFKAGWMRRRDCVRALERIERQL
jgi:REP element-mobilizing transposase RayT